MVVANAEHHDAHRAPVHQKPRNPLSYFIAAGWLRCLWTIPMMFGVGVGCVRPTDR